MKYREIEKGQKRGSGSYISLIEISGKVTIVVPQVKPLFGIPASHVRVLVQVLITPLLNQLPVNAS